MKENIISCPNCNHPLDTSDNQAHCSNCNYSFDVKNGILDFMPGNDFYWGEITREKMQVINEESIRRGNWFKVVTEQLSDRPDLIQYFTDLDRLGWLFHGYKYNNNDVCVDIGSGLGSLSFKLSRFYKEVYSVDGVLDRLNFQVVRAKEENISNIHFIRSPLLKLPFQDESVDLVVVNGVLEWIGLSDFSKKPDELQMVFLREIQRILKPTGVLYLGIENRFGAQYFFGRNDHSNLPFTSLLPRTIASRFMYYLYKKNNKKLYYHYQGFEKGYRTYTYSIWGYEKILQKAGFKYINSNWALPSYSFPKYSGPLDGASIKYVLSFFSDRYKKTWMRLAIKLFLCLPQTLTKIIHKTLAPEFLIIASKASLSNTLPQLLYKTYPEMRSFTRMNMGINTALSSTFHVTNEKVKVTKSVRFKEENSPAVGQHMIKFQNSIVQDGRPFNTRRQEDIEKAAEWLLTYQRQTSSGFWPVDDLIVEIARLIEGADKLFDHKITDELTEYGSLYIQSIKKIQIPIVSEHGDLSPHNIFVESDGNIKVVDWDQTREKGNPLMDVGCFTFSILKSNDNNTIFKDTRTTRSLRWFHEKYIGEYWSPVYLAPVYYLLRLVDKVSDGQDDNNEKIYVQNYWLNFLRITLDYARLGKSSDPIGMNESLLVYWSNP